MALPNNNGGIEKRTSANSKLKSYEHNSGSKNIEELFKELREFTASLTEEEQRAMREGLIEEEHAVFDLLTKPDPDLTTAQEAEVKEIVQELLIELKAEKLVIDWRKRKQTLAGFGWRSRRGSMNFPRSMTGPSTLASVNWSINMSTIPLMAPAKAAMPIAS